MHLVAYFCGTGNPGNDFPGQYDYVNPEHVKTIFVRGCEQPEVCNSQIFPDLKAFANRFVNALFKKGTGDNKDQLEISPDDDKILEGIGIRLDRSSGLVDLKGKPIESITLCGYSRGAVTCFEVARVLNKIAPHIPVDIVADQPVPGNCYQGPGTNAGSIADCSDLTNIRNVSVILGAYTGAMTEFDIHVKKKMPEDGELSKYKNSYIFVAEGYSSNLYYVNQEGKTEQVTYIRRDLFATFEQFDIDPEVEKKHTLNGTCLGWFTDHYKPEAMRDNISTVVHRGFFSQILPKLPRTTNQEHIIIPRESHHQVRPNAPEGQEHMHMKVAELLNRKNSVTKYDEKIELVSDEAVKRKTDEARATYTAKVNVPPAPFPQVSQLQSFFGLNKQDAYRYVDKLHPTANLRKGMILEEGQTLIDWWKNQDRKASRFSTRLTKDLVETIKQTQTDDVEALKKLFVQADKWLIAKENSSTSRYYQVEALRNNIYHHLINQHNVAKEDLLALNRQTLHETGYFLKHWTEGSAAASWFKTDTTRQLDKAFAEHAKVSPHNKEADEKLLDALDTWLELKKDSQSSRYDLVVEMREHLQDVVDNAYREEMDDTATLSK
ncbi:hypothetical protein [Legionella brunensis]|uniref:Uncharacterized protein n=1 Tax=Legionella brunensis TaxID=29422 RepID=A0A0W0SML3_9GAMM|nr:hypothetical protein [Legionella brunensis]KTC84497.1 hypothetical protein Lbru_1365 [Legionella brunensis]